MYVNLFLGTWWKTFHLMMFMPHDPREKIVQAMHFQYLNLNRCIIQHTSEQRKQQIHVQCMWISNVGHMSLMWYSKYHRVKHNPIAIANRLESFLQYLCQCGTAGSWTVFIIPSYNTMKSQNEHWDPIRATALLTFLRTSQMWRPLTKLFR